MKIASFARNGRIDCGLVVDDNAFRVFDAHPTLSKLPSEQRVFALLAMAPEERRQVALEMEDAPVVSRQEVTLLAAVPLTPLYIYAHGNGPTIQLRQHGVSSAEWHEPPRVPFMRIRPLTALCGDGATVLVPPKTRLSCGAELGVVIGREAYQVSREHAMEHMAGLVMLNDNFVRGRHVEFEGVNTDTSGQSHGLHAIYKAADCGAGIGPWITTSEELADAAAARFNRQALDRYYKQHATPWFYDKLMTSRIDGELYDESYTGAYLWGPEDMITYFSRFMRLRTGTILGFAAAGWDGLTVPLGEEPGSTAELALHLPDVGALHATYRRMSPEEEGGSPYLDRRQQFGLSPALSLKERAGRTLWTARGNYRACEEQEGVPLNMGLTPICYPSQSLAEPGSTLVLPPHVGPALASVQMAAVIGPRPVYQATEENALTFISHIVPILAVRDRSLHEVLKDITEYERRGAFSLGCCGDGFSQMGPFVPREEAGPLGEQTMRVSVVGGGDATFQTRDYLHSLETMVVLVSRLSTLLPGDVLCLGVAGPELRLPDTTVREMRASTSWSDPFTVSVDDRRAGRA